MTLEEILALEDIGQKVSLLQKGRRTPMVNVSRLRDDWNPDRHEIMVDKEKYPKIKIVTKKEEPDWNNTAQKTISKPEEYKEVEPNRIAIPLEQDIVNIHTAFTVGTEPEMKCDPTDSEKGLYEALKSVLKKNKIKYQNRKIVRSWLSEQEVAEYWYVAKDDGFWAKLKARVTSIFGSSRPEGKLKSVLWSPFRGDKLYPFFNDEGDLVAFSREYKKRDAVGNETTCFMCITAETVYNWALTNNGWEDQGSFRHKFAKLPVIYSYRPEALCDKIRPIRIRLEKLLSGYADCIDYHFFPILMLFGNVENFSGEFKNRVVELTGNGANAAYLTWNQASDPVKVELDTYFNQAYALTNTPRISFDQLKGTGTALSGVAFRYVFMGAHMAVQNHAEELGLFMQRRVNFLVSGLGNINTHLESASKTIDVEVEIVPFMIDDIDDKVKTAVSAVQGGVWSRRDGVMFAGNAMRVDQTIAEIEEDQRKQAEKGAPQQ
ncbi:MAG: phage portal protein [Paramuribaculum sp.]|nr:phage portal protein [Paramuribaculum sp.]